MSDAGPTDADPTGADRGVRRRVATVTIAGTTIGIGDRLAHGDDDDYERVVVGIEQGHPDLPDHGAWWLVLEDWHGRRTRVLAGDVVARIQHGATATQLRRAGDGE